MLAKALIFLLTIFVFFQNPTARACEKLKKAQELVDSELKAPASALLVSFPKLRNGNSVSSKLTFLNDAGAPRTYLKNGQINVQLPRQYFLGMTAWADATVLCELNHKNCSLLSNFATAYKDSYVERRIPFIGEFIDEPEHFCTLRTTDAYGETYKVAWPSALLGVSLHEIGHVALKHLSDNTSLDRFSQEAHADAFAAHALELGTTPNKIEDRWIVISLLPLLRDAQKSDEYPDLSCRLYFLSKKRLDFREATTDCTRYERAFNVGRELSEALVGPETQLDVTFVGP